MCRNKDRLTFTGTLWDACNAIKEVPRDNLQATLVYLKEQNSLICDALQEIEEVLINCNVNKFTNVIFFWMGKIV